METNSLLEEPHRQEAKEIKSALTRSIISDSSDALFWLNPTGSQSTEKLSGCSPFRSASSCKVQGEECRVDPGGANGSYLALNEIKDDS